MITCSPSILETFCDNDIASHIDRDIYLNRSAVNDTDTTTANVIPTRDGASGSRDLDSLVSQYSLVLSDLMYSSSVVDSY